MTKEEIIKMANQANLPYDYVGGELMWLDKLEQFATLVAEKEREECAKIAENRILHDENKDIKKGYLFAQQSIAQDIRARGQE
jgi:hypothetical protein